MQRVHTQRELEFFSEILGIGRRLRSRLSPRSIIFDKSGLDERCQVFLDIEPFNPQFMVSLNKLQPKSIHTPTGLFYETMQYLPRNFSELLSSFTLYGKNDTNKEHDLLSVIKNESGYTRH